MLQQHSKGVFSSAPAARAGAGTSLQSVVAVLQCVFRVCSALEVACARNLQELLAQSSLTHSQLSGLARCATAPPLQSQASVGSYRVT